MHNDFNKLSHWKLQKWLALKEIIWPLQYEKKLNPFILSPELVAVSTESAVPENVETAIKEFEAAIASSQEGPENEPIL